MDARRQIARMRAQQLAQALVGGNDELRSVALCSDRAHPVIERCIHVGIVEQRRDIGVSRLAGRDLVRVNAAENQQMMVVRQVVQRPMAVPIPLYSLRKPKTPTSTASGGKSSSIAKALPRGAAADGIDLGRPEKGQRVVEDTA